jgi:Flp pilus assembly protein TadD
VAPIFSPADAQAPDGTLQLIDLRMKSGEWSQALTLCRQTLEAEPGRIDVRVRYAAILSLGGNDNEAYREAEAVLAARSDDHRAHLLLAGLFLRRGLPAPAVAHARKAVAAAPTLPEAAALLGQALLADGAHAEARSVLERLAMVRPDDAEVLMNLGSACARGGDTNRATVIFQKVQELQPDSPAPDLALGELNILAGRRAQAIENYRQVLSKAPAHPVGLNNLATLLFEEKGNADEAMRLASQAWQLYPDSPQIADTLGWMYAQAKDYARATVLLGFAVRREPRDPTMRYHLAVVLHARGLIEEADRQLSDAIESGTPFRDAEAARALRERIRGGEAPPAATETNAPAGP